VRPSSRFTVAIHILTLLAQGAEGDAPTTSEFIAGSVNTNPVVIRRLLAALRKARLVRSRGGPGGGWTLVVPARRISLGDVYRAVEDEPLFPLHPSVPNPRCPVGRTIQTALCVPYRNARRAVERDLGRTTIAHLLKEVRTRAG
jgi:Rrf2 family protein